MEVVATEELECDGFIFVSGFESSNLARVESIPKPLVIPNELHWSVRNPAEDFADFEFNLWTRRDCEGTVYETNARTWFYFGVKSPCASGAVVKLNILNLGLQTKLYTEGMSPVYHVVPGKQGWQRIKDKLSYFTREDHFGISFKFCTPTNVRATTYFAFTYPFTFEQLQNYLSVREKLLMNSKGIYFHRECLCHTLEGRPVELITVSSFRYITRTREPRLKNLFPLNSCPRAFVFRNKKVIYISARVHPGETPSSFVLKGFMDYLLTSCDPLAINLRNTFVFKIIPMLNPDGVAKGHFRADSRGVDLNRVYNDPSFYHHPSIYAARSLMLYYHFGREVENNLNENHATCQNSTSSESIPTEVECIPDKCSLNTTDSKSLSVKSSCTSCDSDASERNRRHYTDITCKPRHPKLSHPATVDCFRENQNQTDKPEDTFCLTDNFQKKSLHVEYSTKLNNKTTENDHKQTFSSGLFMYVDLHGHSSKKGVFMYGNYFKDPQDLVECMLFPRIMSLNSENFDFNACSFSERNMSLKDKNGDFSKEGCGRVMAMRLTGILRSYTLECNYNTGRLVNYLPPRAVVDCKPDIHVIQRKAPLLPYHYTPQTFEDVGRALAVSILDLKGCNPWSRIPYSQFRSIDGIRQWLKIHCLPEQETLNKRSAKLCSSSK